MIGQKKDILQKCVKPTFVQVCLLQGWQLISSGEIIYVPLTRAFNLLPGLFLPLFCSILISVRWKLLDCLYLFPKVFSAKMFYLLLHSLYWVDPEGVQCHRHTPFQSGPLEPQLGAFLQSSMEVRIPSSPFPSMAHPLPPIPTLLFLLLEHPYSPPALPPPPSPWDSLGQRGQG